MQSAGLAFQASAHVSRFRAAASAVPDFCPRSRDTTGGYLFYAFQSFGVLLTTQLRLSFERWGLVYPSGLD